MRKLLAVVLMIFLLVSDKLYGYYNFGPRAPIENKVITFGDNTCKNIEQTDIPTIFIPGILASWYSEEGFEDAKIKRWIPDPITHVYDTLFYTFKQNGYKIEDVFYKDEFNLYIEGNPRHSLYAFGYDWKKDNKITATLLNQLILKIRKRYLIDNKCDIGKVNIIGHSMGGLVVRSMLEDMCVEEKYMSESSYYNNTTPGKLKKYNSVVCEYPTKVNKLITISTPHRGSPNALPIWEKGDLEKTDGFTKGKILKSQLDSVFDSGLYNIIHGYESVIPNGIVTLGQLIPDIQNNNEYNNNLKYLSKKDLKKSYNINNNNFPKNSFLEELNRKENIDRIWNRIEGKYISYYSKQTGEKGKNNIVGFTLKGDEYRHLNGETYVKLNFGPNDITESLEGRDIYDKYSEEKITEEYRFSSTVRNKKGLGGDGTVPTYNLKLVPNNSSSSNEVKNDKFESVEIKCYKNTIETEFDDDFLNKNSSPLYENMGKETEFEICSHTNMPIATSLDIYNNISGYSIALDENGENSFESSRKKLLEYIGKANYYNRYVKSFFGTTKAGGIKNYKELDNLFKKSKKEYDFGFKTNFNIKDKYLIDEYARIDEDILNGDALKVDLDFAGTFGKLDRVLTYDVRSPINLLITDSQGRRIGVDPETGRIINEIPGAWTSGDTEGSKEPEFFLIPVSGTGAIEHEIKTYGTGDGEYHIVLNETSLSDEASSGAINEPKTMVIAGTAKKSFGEDYEVVVSNKGEKDFKNITEDLPVTIDLNNLDIITNKQNYKLRYTVRGNSENIGKIRYSLQKNNNNSEIISKDINIDGIININLENIGKYKLTLNLLDTDGSTLKNIESKKEINIERVNKVKTITDKISEKSDLTEVFPEEDKSFDEILSDDFRGILNFYNNREDYFDSSLGFALNNSFEAKILSNNNISKDIHVLLPNGKTNTFKIQKDFSYKKSLDNNLELIDNLLDFEVIDGDKKYYFSKKASQLSKIFINKNTYNLSYNKEGRLDTVVLGSKQVFKFSYDKYTNTLTNIKDIDGNIIDFNYENIENRYVLTNLNGENILYNLNGDIKVISDIYKKVFDKNLIYRAKLEKVMIKIAKISTYKKKKLAKKINLKKQNYLNNIKNNYTRELISYYIDEIINFLER